MIIGSFSTLFHNEEDDEKKLIAIDFAILCQSARLASEEIVFLWICNDDAAAAAAVLFSLSLSSLCTSLWHLMLQSNAQLKSIALLFHISFTHIAIPICLRAIIIRMTNSIWSSFQYVSFGYFKSNEIELQFCPSSILLFLCWTGVDWIGSDRIESKKYPIIVFHTHSQPPQ